jgi:hypothetical protein
MNCLITRSVALLICHLLPVALHAAAADDAASLVETLKKSANSSNGISATEQNIAEKIQKLGAPAIPFLLPLLRDENEGLRELVSYTLRDMEGFTEDQLDVLIDSRRRGDG